MIVRLGHSVAEDSEQRSQDGEDEAQERRERLPQRVKTRKDGGRVIHVWVLVGGRRKWKTEREEIGTQPTTGGFTTGIRTGQGAESIK